MNDISVRVAGEDSVKGRECGNGVAITHPGGWETQYCHMAKGSVRVKNGQAVEKGTVLGLVGMSGNAEFPHLHLTVSHNQQKIDPFAWDSPPGACGSATHSLWSKDAALALAYHSPNVVNMGFAPGQVSMGDVESGRALDERPLVDSPMIVAYVRAIGLKSGDIQILTLRGPGGVALAHNQTSPLDGDKAQLIYFIGKRRTVPAWPAGAYEAQYEVRRDGATALIKRFEFALR
jgi:murein DD-endopeptidase MepM/ murein hydrolase activator NlpD